MSAQTTSQRRAGADLFGQLALGKLSLCRYLASSEGYESFRSKTRGSWLLNKLVGQTMYEKRQMVLLAIAHAIATLVVWQHFFYIKFAVQEANVPVGANLYWWKRLTPPFEFGAMHAILFQMALLPLTMARSTVAYVSQTYFGKKFIPLHKVVAMHIHLGYTMVGFVFASTVLFFVFFGQGCADQKSGKEPSPGGVQTFCKKMTSEIMITGLVIMGCLLLVAVTSFLRNRIKYEYFYVVHHLVFVMFALAIAHTLDDAFRKGQVRSQNFKWFTASLMWYFTDRMHAVMNGRECRVVESNAIGTEDTDGRKVITLRLQRPKTFLFSPGQYVFLSIKGIDHHWHPYSIASAPSDDTIDFFMEVMSGSKVDGHDAWTSQLWRLIKTGEKPFVSVIGPYGTGFNNAADQTEIVAVGSGTGIVPMLSLARMHAANLTRLNVDQHSDAIDDRDASTRDFAENYFREKKSIAGLVGGLFTPKPMGRDGDFEDAWENHKCFQDIIVRCQFQFRLNKLKEANSNATKKLYAAQYQENAVHELTDSLQIFFPVMELLAMAFLVSITQSAPIATQAMRELPLWVFLFLHVNFAWRWIGTVMHAGVWYADALVVAVGAVSFVFLHEMIVTEKKDWSVLLCWGFVAISLYRLARIASDILLSATPAVRACAEYLQRTGDTSAVCEKFTLVFVTPAPDFCKAVWGELDSMFNDLTQHGVSRFLDIQVYCTSKDAGETELLSTFVEKTALGKHGALRLKRPDFDDLAMQPIFRRAVRDEFMGQGRPSFSSSLVAFCGGTKLGDQIGKAVVRANARVKAFSKNHSVSFYQENYGQATPAKQRGTVSLKTVAVRGGDGGNAA